MDLPDDLDRKRAAIFKRLVHSGDVCDNFNAVNAVGSLIAEIVYLRGFKEATLAYKSGKNRTGGAS